MTSIKNLGFYDWIKGPLKVNKTPLLGICLGMQFFADLGSEGRGMHEGLGLIPGEVLRLSPNNKDEKVPHMGWNSVTQVNDHQIYNNIPDESDFYFAHSYHFIPNDRNHVLGHTDYCGGVVSVVSFQNVIGVQFHPEKSSKVGSLMISNFITMTNAKKRIILRFFIAAIICIKEQNDNWRLAGRFCQQLNCIRM